MSRNIFFLLSVLILSATCKTPSPVVKQLYTIQLPLTTEPPRADNFNLSDALCQINDVNINPVYATRRIAIRNQSHQIQYFDHHQWAEKPSELFYYAVKNYISSQQLFKQVARRYIQNTPDYTITVNIFNLEVVNSKNTFLVRLKMEFIFKTIKTNQTIANHHINREALLKQKDLNMMAATISSMFYEELRTFTLMIKDRLDKKNQNTDIY